MNRDSLIQKTVYALQKIVGLLMFVMVCMITIQLIARNMLRTSTAWTEEISKMLLAWLTFLGSPVVLEKGEHLMVDLFYVRLSPANRRYVNLLINAVVIAFSLFIFKIGIDLCLNPIILKSTTPAANIPRIFIYAALPTGAVLMFLVAVNAIIDCSLVVLGKKEDVFHVQIVDESKTLDELEQGGKM